MKYYKLIYDSLNEKVTGTQFQSVTGEFGDIQDENVSFEGRIENDFKLPVPILEDNAKLTSFVNVMFIPNWFLVLENEFISFLSKFNIDEFQVWNIKLIQSKLTFYNYSLFYIPKTYQSKVINYADSDFYSCDFFDHNSNIEKEKIKNYEHYLEVRDRVEMRGKILKYSSLFLNLNELDKDFIRLINAPISGNFISERLKNEIENSNYSGMKFIEIDEIDNFIKIL